MNERRKKTYQDNIEFLKSMIGCSLNSAIQEKYYFKGELYTESMGTLKLNFSNGQAFTFDCDGDAESLNIQKGGFSDKGTLETDFENNRYKWEEKEFLNSEILRNLGQTTIIFLELLTNDFGTIHSGCKIKFKSGDHLHIWTVSSDNIFYGLNETPPYHDNEKLRIELKEIKTLYNKTYEQ
ncbi:hypothetical protein GYB29_07400 [bacterium]|nr:hypothetical protein [bacterium]